MDLVAPLLELLAASLVLPTAIYLAGRSRHPSRSGQRIAGWWCLWAGQLAALMILSAWMAMSIGHSCVRMRHVLAAVIYGGLGASLAGFAAVQAVRLFRLGLSILRSCEPNAIQRSAKRLQLATALPLLGSLALYHLSVFAVPIPGRWTPLMYLIGVLLPMGFTTLLMVVLAQLAIHVHKNPRP